MACAKPSFRVSSRTRIPEAVTFAGALAPTITELDVCFNPPPAARAATRSGAGPPGAVPLEAVRGPARRGRSGRRLVLRAAAGPSKSGRIRGPHPHGAGVCGAYRTG